MKWIIILWLLIAGTGVSYGIYEERNHRIKCLKEMELSLGKLTYFMCEWRMSFEEALHQILRERLPMMRSFYEMVLEDVLKRSSATIGELWYENGMKYLKDIAIQTEMKELWLGCFDNIPLEPEALKVCLNHKRNELNAYLEALQDKYKTEQKLVWTLGVCSSAFLCLMIL